MKTNQPILVLLKMVLDASKTNWQSLDICKQLTQFIAHENGFGCIKNQTYRKMQINLPIIAPMKMVLDVSKTNPRQMQTN